MPIPLSDWCGSCNCGAQLYNSGYHLLTCKTGGGPVWSHDIIAATWGDGFETYMHTSSEKDIFILALMVDLILWCLPQLQGLMSN